MGGLRGEDGGEGVERRDRWGGEDVLKCKVELGFERGGGGGE